MEKILDARGMACPLPVVNAKKAAEALNPGDTLIVRVDNEIAVQNLQRFAQHMGFSAVGEKQSDAEYTVTMHIGGEGKKRKCPAPWMPGRRDCWWCSPPTPWAPERKSWARH